MSRKWEREIERNQKQMERLRKNQKTQTTSKFGNKQVFKGRSVILPVFLLLASFFFMFVLDVLGERDLFYWLSIGSYWLLALIFFLRRPYLAIGSSELTTQRWTKEIHLKPSEVEEIILANDSTVIVAKASKHRWVFSRIPHFYPMQELNRALKQYADKHDISITEK